MVNEGLAWKECILHLGRVPVSPSFARQGKPARVKSVIMYSHYVVDYGAATELLNPGGGNFWFYKG